MTDGGEGGCTEEVRMKISKATILFNKEKPELGRATSERMKENNPMKNPETVAKMKATKKAKEYKWTDERRAKAIGKPAWNKGLTKDDPRVKRNSDNAQHTRLLKDNYKANSGTFTKGCNLGENNFNSKQNRLKKAA